MTDKIKIACVFNTDALGGAERSFCNQLAMVKDLYNLKIYLPLISGQIDHSIEELVRQLDLGEVVRFKMPDKYYQVSRSSGFLTILKFCFELIVWPYYLFMAKKMIECDVLYANGNKVGFFLSVLAKTTCFKGRLIWHFRDYPSRSFLAKLAWGFIAKTKRYTLQLVSNSFSVLEALDEVMKDVDKLVVYNPVGRMKIAAKDDSGNRGTTIGVVAMLSPWKGVHQIVTFASLYQRDLKKLGVASINIYGENIYKTKGEHQGYADDLLRLLEKYPSELVKFCGKQKPEKIYSEIDVLIHPSIRPEPFGRVVTEGFAAGIPVISTAIGGTAELIEHGKTGMKFYPFDYAGLMKNIREIVEDEQLKRKLLAGSKERLIQVESGIQQNLVRAIEG